MFHPQGGGQPSDCGVIRPTDGTWQFRVTHVARSTSTGLFEHHGAFEGSPASLAPVSIMLLVDPDKRALHSVLHSAGHVLDASLQRLGLLDQLAPAKGYHFADGPYVEYTCKSSFTLTTEEVGELVGKLNAAVASMAEEKIPTTIEFLDNSAASDKCGTDLSSYPALVRVVSVGGFPCPCGGTHVTTTEDLNGITVTKIKVKKNIMKISYTLIK